MLGEAIGCNYCLICWADQNKTRFVEFYDFVPLFDFSNCLVFPQVISVPFLLIYPDVQAI
jgi:hypothetical protein